MDKLARRRHRLPGSADSPHSMGCGRHRPGCGGPRGRSRAGTRAIQWPNSPGGGRDRSARSAMAQRLRRTDTKSDCWCGTPSGFLTAPTTGVRPGRPGGPRHPPSRTAGCPAVHVSGRGGPTAEQFDRIEHHGLLGSHSSPPRPASNRLTYVSHSLPPQTPPQPTCGPSSTPSRRSPPAPCPPRSSGRRISWRPCPARSAAARGGPRPTTPPVPHARGDRLRPHGVARPGNARVGRPAPGRARSRRSYPSSAVDGHVRARLAATWLVSGLPPA